MPDPTPPAPDAAWFDDARFGLFVHWGLYAVRSSLGGKEWAVFRDRVAPADYDRYRRYFTGDRFDARAWARRAAAAGMRYVVFTAKHHDGFCLWRTDTTDFHVGNSALGRDVVAELAEACRAEGLRFGLYLSVWDLHEPGLDGGPAHNMDAQGSLQDDAPAWAPSPEGVGLLHAQAEELLTRYGRIDVLWFDVKRAPAAAYRGAELLERARELQPGILINDRLVSRAEATGPADTPDLVTPENRIPATGLVDDAGEPLRWETCLTTNQSWGYVRDDRSHKGGREVLNALCEATGKGGNLLLNVGPDARGRFPEPFTEGVFAATARWLDHSGHAVCGTRPFVHPSRGETAWHPWLTENFAWKCVYTVGEDPDRPFVHVLKAGADRRLVVPRLDGKRVAFARCVQDGSEVPVDPGNFLTLRPDEWTLRLPLHLDPDGPLSVELTLEDAAG